MLHKLRWDSDYFGFPVYQLDPEQWDRVKFENTRNELPAGLIQCRLDLSRLRKIEELVHCGFSLAEAGITYSSGTRWEDGLSYAVAVEEDIPELRLLASTSFETTRIKDYVFGQGASKKFYADWVENAVRGKFDDSCLVLKDRQGQLAGFITVKLVGQAGVKIGLIAVSIGSRGKGFGSLLLSWAKKYASDSDRTELLATTQYANEAAKCLYRSNGFREVETFVWLYNYQHR